MRFYAKKFPLSLLLLFQVIAVVYAQDQEFRFTWRDKSDREMAGKISSTVTRLANENQYKADFRVTWFDADGKNLTDAVRMPYLYISKWDIVGLAPDKNYRCLTFDQTKKSDLEIQSIGSIILELPESYQGEARFNLGFRYALSRELNESGQSENIVLKGVKAFPLAFPVKMMGSGQAGLDGNSGKAAPAEYNRDLMLSISGSYQKIRQRVKEFEDQLSVNEVAKSGYWADLDRLEASVETERIRLKPDSLPADSINEYRNRYSRLNDRVQDVRSASRRLQFNTGNPAQENPDRAGNTNTDSLRTAISYLYIPVFRSLSDSLDVFILDQNSINQALILLFSYKNPPVLGQPEVDSLIKRHSKLKGNLTSFSFSLEDGWNRYRLDIDGLEPVKDIDDLYSLLLKRQVNLQAAVSEVDEKLSSLSGKQPFLSWFFSNRFAWIAFLMVFLLVMGSFLWSSARNRKLLRERFSSMVPGNPGAQPASPGVAGMFLNPEPDEYYTIDYQNNIPDSQIGIVHIHVSAIRSIYQIVQGSLMEKRAADFGGYLFGNQYRLHGKGTSRSELFIEKVCDSRMMRSGIANETDARADLVDELDSLLAQNKKFRLIGWFTASIDSSMEIPEGLMKIHRSFFKEKWQLGMLVNPGTQDLQGAGFLRRKSGYLDPMPDPAAFFKLEDLYRFAVNPTSAPRQENGDSPGPVREYSRIELNNTWGDSVVDVVNFDVQVVNEILSVAGQQAIPRDNYQVVGYLYGRVVNRSSTDGKQGDYELFIDRFIELANEIVPREIPGLVIAGWWGQSRTDVINYLQSAIDYHEQTFREPHQICCLANPATGELRVFTRKHSLVMNNSTIETEEYTVSGLLSR